MHHTIKTSRARQRRIKRFSNVCRSDDNDTIVLLKPIHFSEQLIERFAMVVLDGLARRTDGVDFVDEDDARRLLFGRSEQLSHALRTYTDKHFLKLAPASVEKWYIRLASDGASEQRFARPWRSGEQHTLWQFPTETRKSIRVTQVFDNLLQFLLGFVAPFDIIERLRALLGHVFLVVLLWVKRWAAV